jgi:hypothetical protein
LIKGILGHFHLNVFSKVSSSRNLDQCGISFLNIEEKDLRLSHYDGLICLKAVSHKTRISFMKPLEVMFSLKKAVNCVDFLSEFEGIACTGFGPSAGSSYVENAFCVFFQKDNSSSGCSLFFSIIS